jgi:hypothetical protein
VALGTLALLLAVGGVALATSGGGGGDGDQSSDTITDSFTDTGTDTSTDTGPVTPDPEEELVSYLDGIAYDCSTDTDEPAADAVAAVQCSMDGTDRAYFALFEDSGLMYSYYEDNNFTSSDQYVDRSLCDNGTEAEGEYGNGNLHCTWDGNAAVLEFTFDDQLVWGYLVRDDGNMTPLIDAVLNSFQR